MNTSGPRSLDDLATSWEQEGLGSGADDARFAVATCAVQLRAMLRVERLRKPAPDGAAIVHAVLHCLDPGGHDEPLCSDPQEGNWGIGEPAGLVTCLECLAHLDRLESGLVLRWRQRGLNSFIAPVGPSSLHVVWDYDGGYSRSFIGGAVTLLASKDADAAKAEAEDRLRAWWREIGVALGELSAPCQPPEGFPGQCSAVMAKGRCELGAAAGAQPRCARVGRGGRAAVKRPRQPGG